MLRARLLGAALTGAVLAAALGRLARRRLYRVEVQGESMRPTLEPGDWLLLRRGVPSADLLASGDAYGLVVAARSPSGRLLLKRIVGLPGESLRAGATVHVNGRELDEPYASGEAPRSSYRGVSRLGPGSLFLLGDRRDQSTDSRGFGPLDVSSVEGVVLARYWPPHRIGRLRHPPRSWSARGRPRREVGRPASADPQKATSRDPASGERRQGHEPSGSSGSAPSARPEVPPAAGGASPIPIRPPTHRPSQPLARGSRIRYNH